jgi:hypothetical protein
MPTETLEAEKITVNVTKAIVRQEDLIVRPLTTEEFFREINKLNKLGKVEIK